jgi:hypothetical protein
MLFGRLPLVDQCRTRAPVKFIEEPDAVICPGSGLQHQRLSQRVMAFDQKLVSTVKPLKEVQRWYAIGFTTDAPIALLAREFQLALVGRNRMVLTWRARCQRLRACDTNRNRQMEFIRRACRHSVWMLQRTE